MSKEIRIKKAKDKITELIRKGVQFNVKKVSGSTLTSAGASGSRNPLMKAQSGVERTRRIAAVGSSEKPLTPAQARKYDNEAAGGSKVNGFRKK